MRQPFAWRRFWITFAVLLSLLVSGLARKDEGFADFANPGFTFGYLLAVALMAYLISSLIGWIKKD